MSFSNIRISYICETSQGAVGLAIWVPSVTNQAKESDIPDKRSLSRGYSSISRSEDNDDGNGLELCIVGEGSELEEIDEELFLDNLKVETLIGLELWKIAVCSNFTTVL